MRFSPVVTVMIAMGAGFFAGIVITTAAFLLW